MIDHEWLKNLKVGDLVKMCWTPHDGLFGGPQERTHEIIRINKHDVVVYGNYYFRRSDGRRTPLYQYGDEHWRIEKP